MRGFGTGINPLDLNSLTNSVVTIPQTIINGPKEISNINWPVVIHFWIQGNDADKAYLQILCTPNVSTSWSGLWIRVKQGSPSKWSNWKQT